MFFVRAVKIKISLKDNVWYLDSVASVYFIYDISWFGDNRLKNIIMPITLIDGTNVQASGVSIIILNLLVIIIIILQI